MAASLLLGVRRSRPVSEVDNAPLGVTAPPDCEAPTAPPDAPDPAPAAVLAPARLGMLAPESAPDLPLAALRLLAVAMAMFLEPTSLSCGNKHTVSLGSAVVPQPLAGAWTLHLPPARVHQPLARGEVRQKHAVLRETI